MVHAGLVQNQAGNVTAGIADESDLCIDNFKEKLRFALRENLDLRLTGCLLKQVVAFARDPDVETGRQLVVAHVSFKNVRGQEDSLMLLRRRCRNLPDDALCRCVHSSLMDDQFRGLALGVGDKSDLGVYDLQEVVFRA